MLQFNSTELTNETIEKTRKWFHDNQIACIEEVKNGKVRVNDNEYYFKWRNEEAQKYISGQHEITFTFLQRAYYIQTGKAFHCFLNH